MDHLVVNFGRSVIIAYLWRPVVARPGNFVRFFAFFRRTTPYAKIFKILFRKFSSRHRSTLLYSNVVKFEPSKYKYKWEIILLELLQICHTPTLVYSGTATFAFSGQWGVVPSSNMPKVAAFSGSQLHVTDITRRGAFNTGAISAMHRQHLQRRVPDIMTLYCNNNGLFDLAARAGLVTKSTYI